MIDFDELAGASRRVVTTKPVEITQVVTETVRVAPLSSRVSHHSKPIEQWNWSDLRDYLITNIEAVHGPQVRDPRKEAGILKAFIARWGIEQAFVIAQAACEFYGCVWRNTPLTISRFAQGSDPYFAQVIADKLR